MCTINEAPEIQFHQTTPSTPERFVAGLIDFGSERSNLFSNTSDEYPKLHHLGWPEPEASGGIWKRLLYGWSSSEMAAAEQEYWGRH